MDASPDTSDAAMSGWYALGWLLPAVPGLLCTFGVIGGLGLAMGLVMCAPVMAAIAFVLRDMDPDAG